MLLFRYVPEGMPAFWMLPGGELDTHEDFPEAARRQLLDETGIAADPLPLGVAREFHYIYAHQQVLGVAGWPGGVGQDRPEGVRPMMERSRRMGRRLRRWCW